MTQKPEDSSQSNYPKTLPKESSSNTIIDKLSYGVEFVKEKLGLNPEQRTTNERELGSEFKASMAETLDNT